MGDGAVVAVLDIGKSNVKLSACTADGRVAQTLTAPNPVLPGPLWRAQDLDSVWDWLMTGLATLAARHPLAHFITTGHGSGCVLVTDDPDAAPALPMIDYEQPTPPDIDAAYRAEAGDIWDRGGVVMFNAMHVARQMFWSECAAPADFARARHCLGVPQYWAYRLSGVAAAETSTLAAQSQLWNVRDRKYAAIVARRGWGRLMPPMRHAGAALGPIRENLCARHGVPPLSVHTGAHDSSASFHRYQAAGLREFATVSTGTWIAALTDLPLPAQIDEARGLTINSDMAGIPVLGAINMGGREFSVIAGDNPAPAEPAALARIVAAGTCAVPTFGRIEGQFPGSAGRGRIDGAPPADAAEAHALALLHVALLSLTCGDMVAPGGAHWVLDGSFLRDPAFAGLIAALRPGAVTDISAEPYGIAAGAALLATGTRAPLPLSPARPLTLPGLDRYAARWRALAEGQMR